MAIFSFMSRVRVPHRNVYYYRCPEHRKNYVMSFAFCFDQERDVYHFAYCYPYTYTRLQNYLDNVEMKAHPFFQRELLTSTVVSIGLYLVSVFHISLIVCVSVNLFVLLSSCPNRQHLMSCLAVCLFVCLSIFCFVWPPNSKTKRLGKTKISINVFPSRTSSYTNFKFKRWSELLHIQKVMHILCNLCLLEAGWLEHWRLGPLQTSHNA